MTNISVIAIRLMDAQNIPIIRSAFETVPFCRLDEEVIVSKVGFASHTNDRAVSQLYMNQVPEGHDVVSSDSNATQ